MTVQFRSQVVGEEQVGQDAAVPPVEFDPPLNGAFRWQTRSSGVFRLTAAPVLGTTYRVAVADGIVNTGRNATDNRELGEIKSAEFDVVGRWPRYFSRSSSLRASPFRSRGRRAFSSASCDAA